MIRYIMSFSVKEGQQQPALRLISRYFETLQTSGPAGMRSQCYADHNNDCQFVHIKSFKKEAVANQHFKSAVFREYMEGLSSLSENRLSFSRLQQQESFESIY